MPPRQHGAVLSTVATHQLKNAQANAANAANASHLLGVTAIVLANLCVSYIMTSQVGAALWTYATKHHASLWLR
jgi:hypothetical protein